MKWALLFITLSAACIGFLWLQQIDPANGTTRGKRIWWRVDIWLKTRPFWFHRTYTCAMYGHRWDDISTRMLGVCDRCFEPWPDTCKHCGSPLRPVGTWLAIWKDGYDSIECLQNKDGLGIHIPAVLVTDQSHD